jgi:tol-pal system protein YbgF
MGSRAYTGYRAVCALALACAGGGQVPAKADSKTTTFVQSSAPASAEDVSDASIVFAQAFGLPCAGDSDFTSLQRKINHLDSHLDSQTSEVKKLKRPQQDLYDQLDWCVRDLEWTTTTLPFAEDGVSATSLEPPDSELAGAAAELQSRVASVVVGDGSGTGETVTVVSVEPTAPGQTETTGLGENAAYDAAFDLFRRSRTLDSTYAFVAFLRSYPQSPLADDAWYWLGQSRYIMGEFNDALVAMSTVLQYFPKSPRLPSARLKIGYIYYELGEDAKARQFLNALSQDFSGHPAAVLARTRLEKMDREGR